jgi:hypothetical protein
MDGRPPSARWSPPPASASTGAPVGVLVLAGVPGHRVPAPAQEGGGLRGGGDGQGVDDAGPGQARQVVTEPTQPVRRIRQVEHGQPQRLPVERPAQHQGIAGRIQLLRDIGDHPGVRGRGRRQHRRARQQAGQEGAQPPVVGTEVVPPVRHAVRLVDDQQPGAGREYGQDLLAEVGIVEPLG